MIYKFKYITLLEEEDVLEIVKIYDSNFQSYSWELDNEKLHLEVETEDGINRYIIDDYYVEVIDWVGHEHSFLQEYRSMMFRLFGVEYAYKYLVSH